MSKEFTYWTSVFKKIFFIFLAIIATFICFKLAIFYMPFFIAFIISLMIEPIIRKLMKKFKITRRLSAIIVFIITFGIIIGLLAWGITTLISESANLLSNFNNYYSKAYNQIQSLLSNFDVEKLKVSPEIIDIIKNTSFSLLEKISTYFQNFLTKIVTGITAIPSIAIYFAVTILALYFICTDKIYMLDELEYHLPEKWMKELTRAYKRISKGIRRIFKSTSNININIICYFLSRSLYLIFCWTKCWISTNNRYWNSFC